MAERRGAGRFLAGEQSGGSVVINPSPKTPRRPHISCTSTYILVVYYGRARHHGSLWHLLNPINTNPQIDDGVCRARNSSGIGFTLSRAASTPVGIGHDASRLVCSDATSAEAPFQLALRSTVRLAISLLWLAPAAASKWVQHPI